MVKLKDEELYATIGGASISSSLLNSIARLITTILDLGRTIGSSLYRYKNNDYCR